MSITPSQISGHSGTTTITVTATSATSATDTTWTVTNASGETVQVAIRQKFSPPSNQIWYKTNNSQTATTYWYDPWHGINTVVLPKITANTYSNGWGVVHFDGPLDRTSVPLFMDQPTVTEIWLPNSVSGIGVSGTSEQGTPVGDISAWGIYHNYSGNTQGINLSAVTLPERLVSLQRLVDGAGTACRVYPITSLTIPETVESIGMLFIENVSSVTIPSVCEYVGSIWFGGTGIVVPDSVTGLGSGTFSSCENLQSLTIGSGVTTYPRGMITNCSGITSLTIGENVTTCEPFGGGYLTEIRSYATTAPTITDKSNAGYVDMFGSGTFYYPQGSDYSEWQAHMCFQHWTFVQFDPNADDNENDEP